jgi:hypothetical protein
MSEQELEAFFAGEMPTEDERAQLSRRRFLTGAVAGGAAGLGLAAGTGIAVWKVGDAELVAAKDKAEAALLASQGAAAAELARLQGLVDLYEGLEKIGLDAILETGMMALSVPLAALEAGAEGLKEGLDWAEGALVSLAEALPTARESMLWLEGQVSGLADGVEKLEMALTQAVEKVGDTRVGEVLGDFAAMILDNLPFGLGDKIRGVLEGLVGLITGLDGFIAGINSRLLDPLRAKWFSAEDGEGVQASLVNPLVEHILDPLEEHLGNLAMLLDTWQQKLMAPTRTALEERATVRENIAKYKQEHGFE